MCAAYPKVSDFPEDPQILSEVAFLQECIVAVRRLRADMDLSPEGAAEHSCDGRKGILAAGPCRRVGPPCWEWCPCLDSRRERPEASATAVVKGAELVIPLEGVVDLDAERARLDKEIAKVGKDVQDLERRLGNAGFVAKAPEHVVNGFREKLAAANAKLENLQEARGALA